MSSRRRSPSILAMMLVDWVDRATIVLLFISCCLSRLALSSISTIRWRTREEQAALAVHLGDDAGR